MAGPQPSPQTLQLTTTPETWLKVRITSAAAWNAATAMIDARTGVSA